MKDYSNINHLIIPGGGPYIFYYFNIIKKLISENKLNLKKLKSINGTSAGSILSFLLLVLDIEEIENKFMNFDYTNMVFDFKDPKKILSIITKKGYLDYNFAIKSFEYYLKNKTITENITFKEFYNINKIDFNVYCYDYKYKKRVCLNHKNTPDYKVVNAIYCSCSIPLMFSPLKNNFLIDGGLITNYHVDEIVKMYYMEEINKNKKYNDILSIKLENCSFITNSSNYENTNVFSCLYNIINSIHEFHSNKYIDDLKYINVASVNLEGFENDWNNLYSNKNLQEDIIKKLNLKIEYL